MSTARLKSRGCAKVSTYQTLKEMVFNSELINFHLLEIGAGDGAFAKKVAIDLTQKKNILCVEYSGYGRSEINKFGIKCIAEDVRKIDTAEYKNYFDVVCMFQVLEHMADTDIFFEHINGLTKANANLFIAVPNAYQREFYDLNGVIEDLPPTHIGRWNRQCFDLIAKRYGWTLIRHELEPEKVMSRVMRFIGFRYRANTLLSGRIERIRTRYCRGILRRTVLLLYMLSCMPEIKTLLMSNKLGVSQWVHLRKTFN